MEVFDPQKRKKVRNYSVGGFIVCGLLIFSTLGNLLAVLQNPKLPNLGLLISLVAAVAILVRFFGPPIGFGRGLAIVFVISCLESQIPVGIRLISSP